MESQMGDKMYMSLTENNKVKLQQIFNKAW